MDSTTRIECLIKRAAEYVRYSDIETFSVSIVGEELHPSEVFLIWVAAQILVKDDE